MLVLVAAVGIALFIAVRARRQKTARVDNQPRTLAILPFVNLKPDADSDFLSFSLADAINVKLGNIHTLTVRPSASVSKYRNQTPDPNKVADELHVNTLLTGTYLKEGDELRINAQLIDVRDNKIVRQYATTLKYERLSTVQDEVALHVLEELGLTLTPAELERLQADRDRPALAYEYYLRGVDYYYAEDYLKAIEALKQSVALDANYAPAWARLGSAYSVHGSLNFGGREFYDRAQTAYERALALDPNQHEARAFLADLLVDTGRFEQAVPLLRTVFATHPDDALARWELSYAYRFGGMLEQSIAEAERSRAADPNLELASAPFSAYLYTGQYERFIQSLQRADSSGLLTFYRGLGFYYLQDWTHATTDFDRAYELDPSLLAAQVGHALRFGLSGQKAEGVKVLRQVEARIDQSGVIDGESLYKVAQAYAVLGDRAASLRMLRRSIEGGFVCYPYFTSDPLLDNVRADSAYAAIIEQARVRHEEFKRKYF
jgi:TolB-like protein